MTNRMIGSRLLAGGAALGLLLKVYFLFQSPQTYSPAFQIVRFFFGRGLAALLLSSDARGGAPGFTVADLLWLPWAAVVMVFLLRVAWKILRGQGDGVSRTALVIVGVWFLVGTIYDYSAGGSFIFDLEVQWMLPLLLSDLSGVVMIVGIGLIVLDRGRQAAAAPSGGAVVEDGPAQSPMTPVQVLFSLEGRINRARYWLYSLLLLPVWLGAVVVDLATTGELGAIYWLAVVVCLWPGVALNVKRCHDLNRSGFFYLIAFIPFVSIWYVVEAGFLRGTVGENRFGPDPLGQPAGIAP
ncbi:MAG: DUF805 domain-containing protein [Bacteroidota bacterium]